MIIKNVIQKIFSVTNTRNKKHKIITILGLKIKFKRKDNPLETKLAQLIRTINNINYKQNLIMDYFLEPQNAKQATGALAIRQKENYILLQEFVRICNLHNLNYWIDYGTLLGAQRHGGFVPWDDDIDVSMLKEDFDKFRDIVNDSKKDDFLYQPPYEKCKEKFARLIFKHECAAFLDIYAYEDCGDTCVYMLPPYTKYDKFPIPKTVLHPFKEIQFLDLPVKAPNNIDAYLRIKYGNWHVMPKTMHAAGGHKPLEEHYI